MTTKNIEITSIIEHDPRRWLDAWFKKKNLTIKSTEEIFKNGEQVTIDQVISEMNCAILKKEFLELEISVQEYADMKPAWLEGFFETNDAFPPPKNLSHPDPLPTSPLIRGRRKEGVLTF